MPRSFFEILLEKKNKLIYNSEDEYNRILNSLTDSYLSLLRRLVAVEKNSVLSAKDDVDSIKGEIKGDLDILQKYSSDREKYRWNDPSVQEEIKKISDKLKEDEKKSNSILDKINDINAELLGEDGSLRKANSFFETAYSLMVKGGQKIYEVASLTNKENEGKKRRSNTDIMEVTTFDTDLADIVAKKDNISQGAGESDSDFEKRKKDQEEKNKERDKKRDDEVARLKTGIFAVLAGILGESSADIDEKWNKDKTNKGAEYRNEILKKAIPYMRNITGKKYEKAEGNPFSDEEYMKDISILGTYTPAYQDFTPPKEGEEDMPISDEEKEEIAKYMGDGSKGKSKEILELMAKVEEDNKGVGPKQKAVREEIEKAKLELKGVNPGDACNFENRTALTNAKNDMQKKISSNKDILSKEDIDNFNAIMVKLEEIEAYCNRKRYRK
jgi:hypothetical protein